MAPQHVDPSEAVKMHQELKSRLSLGIHWGTFILTDEREDEPPQLLEKELKKQNSQHPFIVSSIGQVWTIEEKLKEFGKQQKDSTVVSPMEDDQ
jgi:N-acyl-phosphatidylethanolamine-hydrolysing phospholipase D